MSEPKVSAFSKGRLEEKKQYRNGVVYEHWHDSIDNEYHIHLPDGMVIIFQHEDAEGSVTIEEVL